jgi:hypothetical protein
MPRLQAALSTLAMETVRLLGAVLLLLAVVTPARATTGPGCLAVTLLAPGDALNLRAGPSSRSAILGKLVAGRHGIIHFDAPCQPVDRPWPTRWCPVTHYDGDSVTTGWVKARFVRDSECP